jgi:hypothetical protein
MGFWTLYIVPTFRKLDLLPSSGEGEGEHLLGPLDRANLNHWTTEAG